MIDFFVAKDGTVFRPICGGGGSSGGGGQQQTVQKNEPWSEQQPFLKTGFKGAEEDVLNRELSYFPDSTVVPLSGETELSLGGTTARAAGGSPLNAAASNQLTSSMGNDFLNQGNPNFQSMASRIGNTVAPQITSQFAQGGRAFSPAHAESMARGIGDAIAPVAHQNYENERARQLQAAGMAPGQSAQDYVDLGKLGDVGVTRENLSREELDEQIQRHNFAQSEPTNRLAQYMGLIQGNYGGTSTATATGTPRGGSGVGQALGTGMQAASMFIPRPEPTIICTECHRRGWVHDDLFAGDQAFARRLQLHDPAVLTGYYLWAKPTVKAMKRFTWFARAVHVLARPVIHQMAAEAGYHIIGNLFGMAMLRIGVPFCRWLGRRKRRRYKREMTHEYS